MAKRRTSSRNLAPLLHGLDKLLSNLKAVDDLPLRVRLQVRRVARLHRPIVAICHDLLAVKKPGRPVKKPGRKVRGKGR